MLTFQENFKKQGVKQKIYRRKDNLKMTYFIL